MLEVRNLSKHYGSKQALNQVSFSIGRGEAVGFLGMNGAGKSTTMNILTGYLSASDGDVLIDGVDILTDPLRAKTKIGYLPEQPPLYRDMTVQEYLSFVYDLKKAGKKAQAKPRKEYLKGIMELTGIAGMENRIIRNLSKGYQQRVGLAQALVGDPEILILDEPTVGLDPAQIIEIRQLIRQLAQSRTVLLSSHILSEVQAVCGRIIILHQGRLVADGTTEELAGSLSDSKQIELELEGDRRTIQENLKKIPQIVEVSHEEGNLWTVWLRDAQDSTDTAARRAIFRTMAQAGCVLLSMGRRRVSLEEVFLKLTSQPEPTDGDEPSQVEQDSHNKEEEGQNDDGNL